MTIASDVPEIRIRNTNEKQLEPDGSYVLYWMTAFRRTRYNFALQYARDLAVEWEKPLVILEALRVGYEWACDRFHRFIIEGMSDQESYLQDSNVIYYPYVEPKAGEGSGLLKSLAEDACAVVTDDYPCFFHPRMIKAAAKKLSSPLIAVDSNGLMPLKHAERTFTVAHSYRRWMQKELPEHLQEMPLHFPLRRDMPNADQACQKKIAKVQESWPRAELDQLLEDGIAELPIDHSVSPTDTRGGYEAARDLLNTFVKKRLGDYDDLRNEPDELGSSELSPYLHFGQIAAQEIFEQIMEAEDWNPSKLQKPNGKVNGFWGVGENAEAFLDQLCTWREIGFNMCWREEDFDQFDSLPDWALKTMDEHEDDEREHVYSLEEFEKAETHDEIWNAAQRQLVRDGRIHNYLRMLWGKKILHWTKSPQDALDIMIELNNKYALDGRDPNSYSGIFWVLGRYDRAWGPERPIFGKIRYMTSESTAKKHRLNEYLDRYSD